MGVGFCEILHQQPWLRERENEMGSSSESSSEFVTVQQPRVSRAD